MAVLILAPLSAWANMGPSGTGGGNELVAHFISEATSVIDGVAFTPEEKELLESALRNSRIKSVSVLRDPQPGQPDSAWPAVPDQTKLVAWGSAGLIQLKDSQKDQNADSWAALVTSHRPIAHEIVHELFRASGAVDASGRSIDDVYQLSIGKYHLNQTPAERASLGKVLTIKCTPQEYWRLDAGDGVQEMYFVFDGQNGLADPTAITIYHVDVGLPPLDPLVQDSHLLSDRPGNVTYSYDDAKIVFAMNAIVEGASGVGTYIYERQKTRGFEVPPIIRKLNCKVTTSPPKLE